MCIYACVYIYVCVCLCVCVQCMCAVYVYVIVCMCMSAYVSVCRYTVCMSMHVTLSKFMQVVCDGTIMCVYVCVCMHVCMPACMYACMHVCIFIRENIVTAHMSPYACAVSLNFPLEMSKTSQTVPRKSHKIYVSLCVSLCLLGRCFGAVRPKRSGLGGGRGGIARALSHERTGPEWFSDLRMVEERGRKYTRHH